MSSTKYGKSIITLLDKVISEKDIEIQLERRIEIWKAKNKSLQHLGRHYFSLS